MASPKCPKCSKAVYFVEQQPYLGTVWHKACFKCEVCGKALVGGSFVDHESKPHCQSCYNKHHRPKGFGHGTTTVDSHKYEKPIETTPAASSKFCGSCGKPRGAGKFCGGCGKE